MLKYFLILMLYISPSLLAQSAVDIPEVLIKGGSFDMGCTLEQEIDCQENEYPVKQVQVADFYMSVYEVTQELWVQVMRTNPSHFRPFNKFKGCKKCPVESISWSDVQNFIEKLNEMTGKKYRLPTEAEWEYAARGGQKAGHTRFAGSEDIEAVCWYDGNSGNRTQLAGSKDSNELGLYDMSGNVWEWCSDTYENKGVLRGGGWGSFFWDTRTSVTDFLEKKKERSDVGFRLARSK